MPPSQAMQNRILTYCAKVANREAASLFDWYLEVTGDEADADTRHFLASALVLMVLFKVQDAGKPLVSIIEFLRTVEATLTKRAQARQEQAQKHPKEKG